MKNTSFCFVVKFIDDQSAEITSQIESFPGVDKVEFRNDTGELVIKVQFSNSKAAERLHRKIMKYLIKSNDRVRIMATRTILTESFNECEGTHHASQKLEN